jgi:hypothetical protein
MPTDSATRQETGWNALCAYEYGTAHDLPGLSPLPLPRE